MPVPAPSPPPAAQDRIRVLEVIKGLGHGGAERLLVEAVVNGDRDRFDYEVCYILDAASDLAGELESEGVLVHALGASRSLDPGWLRAFRAVIRNGEFDIVHFHLPYSAALGRLVVATLPRDRRPVTLYTEHSLWNKVSPPVKLLNRATTGRDAAIIAVSPAAFDALPRPLLSRARVVVHGIDLAPSRSMTEDRERIRRGVRDELGCRGGDLLAVTVANLRSEKGYDVLLEAAAAARDGTPVLRFVAVGQGDLEGELTSRRDSLGLGDTFRFLGYRRDALRLLTAADVVVLPSHQEGLPVVLMEAMSVGATVVATTVGGVPRVITDGINGLLVPPGRPDALAEALIRLAGDPQLRHRLGEQALHDSTSFDVCRSTAEIEQLYRQVLARVKRELV
ncbi:MAG: glycosyltransferase [Acidimicrobiales bacterium]